MEIILSNLQRGTLSPRCPLQRGRLRTPTFSCKGRAARLPSVSGACKRRNNEPTKTSMSWPLNMSPYKAKRTTDVSKVKDPEMGWLPWILWVGLAQSQGSLRERKKQMWEWKKEVGGRRGRSQKPGNAEGLPPEVRKGKEVDFPTASRKNQCRPQPSKAPVRVWHSGL